MSKINIQEIVENLIETFLSAGKISLQLRLNGLTKEIKSDNTPVSNGDLEVNRIVSKKLKLGYNRERNIHVSSLSVLNLLRLELLKN